uniref:Uncharacterized protein n=1 Tax=Oryza glumipatula TaxID=40148 RepID=A0A0E0A5D1_9ORYZ
MIGQGRRDSATPSLGAEGGESFTSPAATRLCGVRFKCSMKCLTESGHGDSFAGEGIIELITPMVAKMEMLALISLIFEEKIKCLLRTGND